MNRDQVRAAALAPGFISGGGGQGGAFAPPMKVFAPPQELVELILALHTETKAIVGCIIYHWVV